MVSGNSLIVCACVCVVGLRTHSDRSLSSACAIYTTHGGLPSLAMLLRLTVSPCFCWRLFFRSRSARLDCSWRAAGTNVMSSASGCRTIVQRPTPICPSGCVVIEQTKWNSTVGRSQLFTKCSCKAGNQPCPYNWFGCTCYEGLSSRNLTRGFVVCSETQGECDRKCVLAVSGEDVGLRLAPLCPAFVDPLLSTLPTEAPKYPRFGYNLAGSQSIRGGAALAASAAASGRSLKQQLVGLRRRLTMVAADWPPFRLGSASHQLTPQAQQNAVGAEAVEDASPQRAAAVMQEAGAVQQQSWAQWVAHCVHTASGRLSALRRRA